MNLAGLCGVGHISVAYYQQFIFPSALEFNQYASFDYIYLLSFNSLFISLNILLGMLHIMIFLYHFLLIIFSLFSLNILLIICLYAVLCRLLVGFLAGFIISAAFIQVF